jgi:hypothetical protein
MKRNRNAMNLEKITESEMPENGNLKNEPWLTSPRMRRPNGNIEDYRT